jgi:hypothetical protein
MSFQEAAGAKMIRRSRKRKTLRRRAAELHAESEAIRRQHERTADSRLH